MTILRWLPMHGRTGRASAIATWAVIAVTVLTIAAAAVTFRSYRDLINTRSHSRQTLFAADDVLASLTDAETGQRGYVITGDLAFLEPYNTAMAQIGPRLDRLTSLVADDALESETVRELRPVVEEKFAELGRTVEVRRTRGVQAAATLIADAEGKRLMDRARELIGGLNARENEQVNNLTSRSERRVLAMTVLLVVLGLAFSVLMAVIVVFLRRRGREEVLRRSNEAKDQFVGLVSHELRNPITTISAAATLLRERGKRLSEDELNSVYSNIETDAARLDRTVANMLLVARLDDPQADLEPVLLQHVLPRCAALHQRRFPNREVLVCAPAGLPPVQGDASFIEQVLLNLLGNSEKYADGSPIAVEAAADAGAVRVAVLDRGDGIGEAEGESLFQPFFRSDAGRRRASGAGLGLAVCRRLVEVQGGRIWARARPGGGSEFCFTLPVAAVPGEEEGE